MKVETHRSPKPAYRGVGMLAAQLTAEYGRRLDRHNLFTMERFAEVFPDEAIVNALRTQLSWVHFRGEGAGLEELIAAWPTLPKRTADVPDE